MKIKQLLIVAIGVVAFWSCEKDEPAQQPTSPNSGVNNNVAEINERVTIKNEPIDISGKRYISSGKKGNSIDAISSTQPTDCQTGCTQTISGAQNGNLNINNNQHVCITSSGVFQGNVNLNGGVLSVCGNLTVNNINLNNGAKLIINAGGILNISGGLNINNGSYFVNYSKSGVNISGHMNNNGTVENYGDVDIAGNYNNNGNSTLINSCRMDIAGNFHQNGDMDHFGFLNINGTVHFNNPTGNNDLNGGSLIACQKVFVNTTLNGVGSDYSKIDVAGQTIINGSGNLTGLLDICDSTGIDVNNGTFGPNVTQCAAFIPSSGDCNPGSGDAPEDDFTLVADVDAPTTNDGRKLSATCIQIIGDYAYVSWHLNDGPQDYAGLLEVYDISNPTNPLIITTLWSADIDFNHLYASDNMNGNKRKLWAIGSRDIYSSNLSSPAYLGKFTLTNEIFTNNTFEQFDLPSFSGNSVIERNGLLYLVSGQTGGALTTMDTAGGPLTTQVSNDRLKYLDFDGNKMIMLKQGNSSSELMVYDLPNPNFSTPTVIQVGPINPADGKNVAHINNGKVYVATGTYGLKVFDAITGSSSPIATFNPSEGATNGVSTDDEYIYVANGESGLHILNKNDATAVGNYNYDGSANFVASKSDFIFVANGTGGLKIIHKN
jgi:hypothetical protein